MANNLTKALTVQQRAFLDFLRGDARGDINLAKDLAGYAKSTAVVDVVRPIKDHVLAAVRDVLVNHGVKAAFAAVDVMENPAEMGSANKLKAAESILDRIGVTTPQEQSDNAPKAAVFILPPKGVQQVRVEDGNVTIDMGKEELVIDPETPEKNLDFEGTNLSDS